MSTALDGCKLFKIFIENITRKLRHNRIYLIFFNEYPDKGIFLSILKFANITPVFKKGNRGSKDSYRPLNLIPVI